MFRSILLGVTILVAMPFTSVQAQDKFLGKSAADWAQVLKASGDARQRRNAAFALGKMGSRAAHAVPAMKRALSSEKAGPVRDALLFALGDICRDSAGKADAELEQVFAVATRDGDPLVRRSAVYALGCLAAGTEATGSALDQALEDPEAVVRQNVAWALGRLGAKQGAKVLPALQKLLHDPDSLVKRDAASALLQIADGDAVHKLVKDLSPLCRDTNSEVRRAALSVLARIVDPSDKDAIPPLKWALEDRDLENKRNAALALTNIGGEETAVALPVLLEAARSGDVDMRRQAVMAVRNIGPRASGAVPALMKILRKDKDDETRRNAALALGGIGKGAESAVPLLMDKIKTPTENRDTRIECAMALTKIGPVPAAVAIVPDLLQVLVNPDQDIRVRERTIWSLRVHAEDLQKMNGPYDAFTQVLKEPVGGGNKMLRYDCAYMLGMIWQQKAPDATLTVLNDFLADKTIVIYKDTKTSVTAGPEGSTGLAKSQELFKGDGRVMAVDALRMIGPARYSVHRGIMDNLKSLANDKTVYEPLRKKAEDLVRTVQ